MSRSRCLSSYYLQCTYPLTASSTDVSIKEAVSSQLKRQCVIIAYTYKVKMSLLKCVTTIWFSMWRVRSASTPPTPLCWLWQNWETSSEVWRTSVFCIIQIPVLCQCSVDFWPYMHRCTQISLTGNRGPSGENRTCWISTCWNKMDTKKVFEQYLTFLDPRK